MIIVSTETVHFDAAACGVRANKSMKNEGRMKEETAVCKEKDYESFQAQLDLTDLSSHAIK